MVSQLDIYTAFICCSFTVSQCTPQTSIYRAKWWRPRGVRGKLKCGSLLLLAQRSLCIQKVRNPHSGPGLDPSIHRHSGIWGAADEAVLNIVWKKIPQKIVKKKCLLRDPTSSPHGDGSRGQLELLIGTDKAQWMPEHVQLVATRERYATGAISIRVKVRERLGSRNLDRLGNGNKWGTPKEIQLGG